MEEFPNSGIKLFGATLTLQHRNQQKPTTHRNTANNDENEKTHNTDEMKKPDKIIPCPRCKSMDTKFCYFNNYNVNQPRHFCKGCQRYWTAGGALRNVPIGAGRRKNKPVPCGRGFSDIGSDFYDANSNIMQHYFDREGSVVVENSWHLMTAAQSGFRQMIPAVKRQRNGEVDS